MKLYEFSAVLSYNVVVAAESEEAAREEIHTWEKTFTRKGEFIELNSVELFDVREVPKDVPLEDVAHVVAEAAGGDDDSDAIFN